MTDFILKKILVLLCVLSSALFADVHPALKKAIDSNDIATAKNLRSMGVKDVYCPETLSPADGDAVYNFTEANYYLDDVAPLFTCNSVFIKKFVKEFCDDKLNNFVPLCRKISRYVFSDENRFIWQNFKELKTSTEEIFYSKSCLVDTTICLNVLNGTPYSRYYHFLKQLQKSHLDKIEYTVDSTFWANVKKSVKVTKQECVDSVKNSYDYRHGKKTVQAKLLKDAQKKCKTKTVEKDVREEQSIKVTRIAHPLNDVLSLYVRNRITPMRALIPFLGAKQVDEINTALSFGFELTPREEYEILDVIRQKYVDGTISDSMLLFYCRISPNIHKLFTQNYSMDVFNCDTILSKYTAECGNDGKLLEAPGFSGKWTCIDDLFYKVVSAVSLKYNSVCVKSNENAMTEDKKFICHNGEWIYNYTDSLVDKRDGHIYKVVKIGDQIWMAENLNYADSLKTSSLKGNSWCYDNKSENCVKTGRLYTWAAAIDSVALANDSKNPQTCGYNADANCSLSGVVRGVCPKGWHLPSMAEFEILQTATGGCKAGTALKSKSGWLTSKNAPQGSDIFGFSAIPFGGSRDSFDSVGEFAHFWSTGGSGYVNSYYFALTNDSENATLSFKSKDKVSFVRCVQDSN